MNIDINDYYHRAEFVDVSYFIDNSDELFLAVEFESLVEHIEYEGMNEGYYYNQLQNGEVDIVDTVVEPVEWTTDNLREALTSYLKHYHKTKSW